ncbi:chorismate mutase [Neomoorella mulderi]|uniref:chorismate mutase n=1 Tax=Moorella mulderi DSM 14980 TaxID=1122241 RepID=A0A151AZN4_9FIRM|nr:chorismate mutase [Moorella mulderi]KYH33030.1 chorismate mutase AroH [Moorella mulderi DSM 14980]
MEEKIQGLPGGGGKQGSGGTKVRGLRGAVDVPENTAAAILTATEGLLREILARNRLAVEDIISAIFTVTPDLNAAFPAEAARRLGWQEVALMCATEIPVPGSLPGVVRVLIHAYSDREPVHVYLGRAAQLRPDLR